MKIRGFGLGLIVAVIRLEPVTLLLIQYFQGPKNAIGLYTIISSITKRNIGSFMSSLVNESMAMLWHNIVLQYCVYVFTATEKNVKVVVAKLPYDALDVTELTLKKGERLQILEE